VLLFVLIVANAFSSVALASGENSAPKFVYHEERTKVSGGTEINPHYWIGLFSFPEIVECKVEIDVSEGWIDWLLLINGEWVEFIDPHRVWDIFVFHTWDKQTFAFLPGHNAGYAEFMLEYYYDNYSQKNIVVDENATYKIGHTEYSGRQIYIPVRLAKEKWETYFPKSTVTFEGEGDGAKCTVKAPGKRAKEIDRKGEKGINLLVVDGEQYITPYIYKGIIKAAAGY